MMMDFLVGSSISQGGDLMLDFQSQCFGFDLSRFGVDLNG